MSAWSVLTAAAGLSIRDGVYTLAPCLPGDDQRLLVSYPQGGGWGHYVRRRLPTGWWHALEVSAGTLVLQGLRLTGHGSVRVTVDGQAVEAAAERTADGVVISLPRPVTARILLSVTIRS